MVTVICQGYTALCYEQDGQWVAEVFELAPWVVRAWAESFDELLPALRIGLSEHEAWLMRDVRCAMINAR